MNSKERIKALTQWGLFLEQFSVEKQWDGYDAGVSQTDFEEFNKVIEAVHAHNGWFTPAMVRKAIGGISSWLKPEILEKSTATYSFKPEKSKTVAVIMAGNIPLVGFHDALCVLLTGNKLLAKFSSDDDVLMPLVLKYLVQIEPRFNDYIRVTADRMTEFDAVIATGSNNSARYFEEYFGKYPHIIRKNRTSVAVLSGNETEKELNGLAHDVFDFYGLGCRNVTKIYVPEGYDLNRFFSAVFPFSDVINNKKYANNYDYHKAIFMMNQDKLIENGFIVLKEDQSIFSPIGMLYYEYYKDKNEVYSALNAIADQLQCIVSSDHVPFGQAQCPGFFDFADGVDTLGFVASIG